jgi:hypothetical protein
MFRKVIKHSFGADGGGGRLTNKIDTCKDLIYHAAYQAVTFDWKMNVLLGNFVRTCL